MSPTIAASALLLSLLLFAARPATAETPAAPSAGTPSAAQVANDDAAKHAKRTACLKDARTRKLIGSEKTAFVKSCMDAAAQAISASRVDRP